MNRSGTLSALRILGWVGFWIVLPLLLGAALAYLLVPAPQIGLIRLQDMIWTGSGAYLAELLERAQEDPRIRAVVLQIDSPGGEVTATEEIYYRLLELRRHKPLVVTVDNMAASGGYYVAAAADHIYAKPASMVGNVGVISFLPPADERRFADEDYVSTGPFKFSGGSRGDYMRQIELSKLGFLEAVFAQREDRLRLDRESLSSGEIFMGLQALRLGLIDELGANSEAVRKAADLAHLRNYEVVEVDSLIHAEELPEDVWLSYDQLQRLVRRGGSSWRQGLYYLYVEPRKRAQ
jgi:protease-4